MKQVEVNLLMAPVGNLNASRRVSIRNLVGGRRHVVGFRPHFIPGKSRLIVKLLFLFFRNLSLQVKVIRTFRSAYFTVT